MLDNFKQLIASVAPSVDYYSALLVDISEEHLNCKKNDPEPVAYLTDKGVLLTVVHQGAQGFAHTSDLSQGGLKRGFQKAKQMADLYQAHGLLPVDHRLYPSTGGSYHSETQTPWSTLSMQDKWDLLQGETSQMAIDDKVVDWGGSLWSRLRQTVYVNSLGAEIDQQFHQVIANTHATAFSQGEAQRRSLGAPAQLGGVEVLKRVGFMGSGRRVSEEALALLAAPDCPDAKMDLLLAPDQMMLQIHESIGHPVELDRILGDERNYAGTSFVTPDMFGQYRYGSECLNVTFDPDVPYEFANYGFDDEGAKAEKTYIIEKGMLKTPLGGVLSQQRASLPGVANSRVESWYRPPIDRISNLNVEPGDSSLEALISEVEDGIFMHTNRSWSIDDSRNKFQFGCEYARRIKNGELKEVVKNPNYRGISANFWRSLKSLGDKSTFEVHGTPLCGKGELNQIIAVGHASPVALFSQVDVFGAGK